MSHTCFSINLESPQTGPERDEKERQFTCKKKVSTNVQTFSRAVMMALTPEGTPPIPLLLSWKIQPTRARAHFSSWFEELKDSQHSVQVFNNEPTLIHEWIWWQMFLQPGNIVSFQTMWPICTLYVAFSISGGVTHWVTGNVTRRYPSQHPGLDCHRFHWHLWKCFKKMTNGTNFNKTVKTSNTQHTYHQRTQTSTPNFHQLAR